ncbi:hypothetical protein L9F63_024682, partial [Diploptera punctata]
FSKNVFENLPLPICTVSFTVISARLPDTAGFIVPGLSAAIGASFTSEFSCSICQFLISTKAVLRVIRYFKD